MQQPIEVVGAAAWTWKKSSTYWLRTTHVPQLPHLRIQLPGKIPDRNAFHRRQRPVFDQFQLAAGKLLAAPVDKQGVMAQRLAVELPLDLRRERMFGVGKCFAVGQPEVSVTEENDRELVEILVDALMRVGRKQGPPAPRPIC